MYKLTAVLASIVLVTFASAAQAKPPNIVVIVADDLGYADVGAQGISKDVRTPNIDTIAKNGVRCTNGYVSCPVCSPTRAGLMTGRYQQRFGHEFNPGPNEADNFGLPTDQVTIAQALKEGGYVTGMFGKWHLGYKPEQHPTRRGFDEFLGFMGGAHPYHEVGAGKNVLMRGTEPMSQTDYLTDVFGREAAAFVDRHAGKDKPFFLYLPFNAIHTPQQAPKKYLDRFPSVTDEKRKLMLAMLSAQDDAVGLVLGKIREHQIEDSTLIFYISDNGGPTRGNGSRNDPLSGFKGDVHEGGVREPFFVQWKGKLKAGKVYDQPVIALDIFPTALSAAGIDTPRGVKFDGVNLLPHLLGEKTDPPHQNLFWRFGPQWAVRDGNYKLRLSRGDTAPMLFDLSKDIAEAHDLSAKEPEVAKRLKGEYDAWNAKNEPPRWRTSPRGRNARRAGAAATTQAGEED
jgi:arylsulfatase A-like enzyme